MTFYDPKLIFLLLILSQVLTRRYASCHLYRYSLPKYPQHSTGTYLLTFNIPDLSPAQLCIFVFKSRFLQCKNKIKTRRRRLHYSSHIWIEPSLIDVHRRVFGLEWSYHCRVGTLRYLSQRKEMNNHEMFTIDESYNLVSYLYTLVKLRHCLKFSVFFCNIYT